MSPLCPSGTGRVCWQGYHQGMHPYPCSAPRGCWCLQRGLWVAPASFHAKGVNLATSAGAEPGAGAGPARSGRSWPAGCSPSPGSSTCLWSNVSAQHPPGSSPIPSTTTLPAPQDPAMRSHHGGPVTPLGWGPLKCQHPGAKAPGGLASCPCSMPEDTTQLESITRERWHGAQCCSHPLSAVFLCCKPLLQLDFSLSLHA